MLLLARTISRFLYQPLRCFAINVRACGSKSQLAIILISKVVLGNIVEAATPTVTVWGRSLWTRSREWKVRLLFYKRKSLSV